MKKVISLAVALVLCLSIFAGCGAKEVNLADLMDKMNSEYSVDATKYETKHDMYKYYNINADDIKQFAAEVGKSDTMIIGEKASDMLTMFNDSIK